jgi:hypothetical protein
MIFSVTYSLELRNVMHIYFTFFTNKCEIGSLVWTL